MCWPEEETKVTRKWACLKKVYLIQQFRKEIERFLKRFLPSPGQSVPEFFVDVALGGVLLVAYVGRFPLYRFITCEQSGILREVE